ncbi:AMP-binding protein [Paraburkholderia acidicola]|uniref:AMP-binding protein n=1 Tax=Paraburkholderia acidicola TaxID=1912599 RepID=A0ABV1LUL6_9BURK
MPIHDNVLTRATSLFADDLAIVDGHVRMTYRELSVRASGLAAGMSLLGLQPGDRVGFLGRNSFRCIEVNLACAIAGLVLVPINFRLSDVEVDYIAADTGLQLLFVEESYRGRAGHTVTWSDGDAIRAHNGYEALLYATDAQSPLRAPATGNAVAQIFYTSGTTGHPKGVCLTRANMGASALDAIISLQMNRQDGWLHASPMFHLVDAFAIWAVTLVGGRHIINHFAPDQFGPLVQAERISKTSLPPTLLDRIVREPSISKYDLSSLDLISYGGSPMQDAVYRRCQATLGCAMLQAYGLTEGSGFVCHEACGDNPLPQQALNTVGHPTLHTQIRLVDESGRAIADGEPGEILIRGARVFERYWEKPEATAAAFTDDGWYRTGDIGRRDHQGRYQIVGRKKEMVISGGENIYPAEVQNVLLSCPGVAEAAVFGVPSEAWGEEVRAVVYVEGPEGRVLTEAELIGYCRPRIAGYKLPKKIVIVDTPLPKNGPGKIATSQIRARHIEETKT